MTFQYRPHQIACPDDTERAWQAGLRPLNVLCVGSGKSICAAEISRRAVLRGNRVLVLAHRPELVQQLADAHEQLGVKCGINASKLGQRTWRGSVICAMINSVYRNARSFGPIDIIIIDECHMIPLHEAGMYREFLREYPNALIVGFTGTPFRLQGGSLLNGEGAFFNVIAHDYTIIDGIRDGYLVPAFSAPAVDKVDVSKLKKSAGDYTASSQDQQTIALMDSHIQQMLVGSPERKAWLIFEASQKSALAMGERLNAWGVPAGVIIDKTHNRKSIIDAFNRGQLRALVNVETLTTGFDSQRIDLVCFRRRTTSLGLYVQMCGRGLRTIGGNIESSIAAGKSDCLYYDFAGLIDQHGALDFIRPRETKVRLVSCESCGKRNASAAVICWSCGATMLKNCPACLESIPKYMLDCPHCGFNMRREETAVERAAKLLETPSGAALIASYKTGAERQGGWIPVRRAWQAEGAAIIATNEGQWALSEGLGQYAPDARWIRLDGDAVGALLLPNGASRSNAWQVNADGSKIIVPLPGLVAA